MNTSYLQTLSVKEEKARNAYIKKRGNNTEEH
jgi:hypothetical protein